MIQLKYTEKHTKRVRHRLMTHPPSLLKILFWHLIKKVINVGLHIILNFAFQI